VQQERSAKKGGKSSRYISLGEEKFGQLQERAVPNMRQNQKRTCLVKQEAKEWCKRSVRRFGWEDKGF